MNKIIGARFFSFVTVFLFLFLFNTVFISAFFSNFIVNNSSVNVVLDSLKSTTTSVSVSIDPAYISHFEFAEGGAKYSMERLWFCNNEDEDGVCIDPTENLCPYLSFDSKNEEDTEVGFSQNYNNSSIRVVGEINGPDDLTDNWDVSIVSPCFSGECPADYDTQKYGDPLPQSFKGKTFRCDIYVESIDPPVLVKGLFGGIVSALVRNKVEISAVFTGDYVPEHAEGASNVLFIPGLEASRLYKQGILFEDQLWEPNNKIDVEQLYLDVNGNSLNSGIYTRDIIKETNTPLPSGFAGQNVYKSFSNMMDGLVGSGKINRWESYAYDWRQEVQDIVYNGTNYFDEKISLEGMLDLLSESSQNGKVTIVAHSNGGLIAKALLKKLQDDKLAGLNNLIDKVDNLILVAVPQIGTALAVPATLHGYDQRILGGILLDEIHARELGRNMLSGYGLLPSREYIKHVGISPVTFIDGAIPSGVTTSLVGAYGSSIDSYIEYINFIFGNEGRVSPAIDRTDLPIKLSANLFHKAEVLHDSIDSFAPPASLRVIEVAGWGLRTVASFQYYPKFTGCLSTGLGVGCNNVYMLDQEPEFTIDGDGTVIGPSAQYMSFLGKAEKYWVDLPTHNRDLRRLRRNREHKDILEVDSLNNLINSVIENKEIVLDNVLRDTMPVYTGDLLRISVHSPVSMDAYDSEGNHTGKICPPTSDFCYIEEGIVNSSYLEFGEGKYINLPESEFGEVRLQGTGIGTFTYESEKVSPDGAVEISRFVDIPVTTQTQAKIVLNQNNTPELKLDVTGDGMSDFTILPKNSFDPVTYLQIMKATVNSLDLNQIRKNNFERRINNIIKSIQKGKIDKTTLRVERFRLVLDKRISKTDPKHPKIKRLSKTDAQLLLDMLNQLLDNLD